VRPRWRERVRQTSEARRGALASRPPLQLRTRCAQTKETSALHATLETEHNAVEEDYKRVEQELAVARNEVRAGGRATPSNKRARVGTLSTHEPPPLRRPNARWPRWPRRRRPSGSRRRWSG
jgi:hypothetical protein